MLLWTSVQANQQIDNPVRTFKCLFKKVYTALNSEFSHVQCAYLCQSFSKLHCRALIIFPYNATLPLCVRLTLLVAVMWAFLHSDQTIRDVLPAYGPLHHQHALIWSFALQRLTRRGCACSYVWHCVCVLKKLFKLRDVAAEREGLSWRVWCVKYVPGLSLLRRQASRWGETRSISFWLLSIERAREGGGGRKKKQLVFELMRNSWMTICNRDQTRRNKTRRVTHVDSQPHDEFIRWHADSLKNGVLAIPSPILAASLVSQRNANNANMLGMSFWFQELTLTSFVLTVMLRNLTDVSLDVLLDN